MNTLVFSLKQLVSSVHSSAQITGITIPQSTSRKICIGVFELLVWQRECFNAIKWLSPVDALENVLTKGDFPEKELIRTHHNFIQFAEDIYWALDDVIDVVIPHNTWDMHLFDISESVLAIRVVGDYRIVKHELQQRGLCNDHLPTDTNLQ